MAEVAAHGEHQRKLLAGRFGQTKRLFGQQLRLAAGGGKPVIDIQPRPAATRLGARGEGPLLRTMLCQKRMTETAQIAHPPRGERSKLRVHLSRRAVTELLLKTETLAKLRKNRPIGPSLARGLSKGRTEGDAPLRVGHHAALLAPLGRRQQQVGYVRRFSTGISLTENHKRAIGGGSTHPIQGRHAHQRISGGHPPQPQLTALHRLDLIPHRQAWSRGDRAGPKPPVALHLSAVLGVSHEAIARQQLSQTPGLTAAHRIGLTGEREGAGSGTADLGSGQMQVDDPGHGGRSLAALVHPHRPEAEHPGSLCPPLSQLAQIGFGDATEIAHPLRRPLLPQLLELGKSFGVGLDEGRIDGLQLQQQMTDALEQHQIGAWTNRQMQVRRIRGGRGPWIHHHQPQSLILLALAFQQPLKQHRVAVGRVGADQEDQIGMVEVVVTTGRAIGSEAAGISGHRRTHAQAGIGIEVVAAQGPLEQLVGHVVVLGEELTGAVDRQTLWSLLLQRGSDARHQEFKGPLPADWRKPLIEALAPQRGGEAVVVQGFAHRGALHAHLPQRGGVVAITTGRPLRIAGISRRLELKPAAHSAVRTLSPRRLGSNISRGGRVQCGSHQGGHCTKAADPTWLQPLPKH